MCQAQSSCVNVRGSGDRVAAELRGDVEDQDRGVATHGETGDSRLSPHTDMQKLSCWWICNRGEGGGRIKIDPVLKSILKGVLNSIT